MKKILFSTLFVTLTIICNGQIDLSLGLGIGNTQKAAFAEALYGNSTKNKVLVPPVFVAVDFTVDENYSIGGYVNISKIKVLDEDKDFIFNSTFFNIGIRGLYKFETESKFKPYIGAGLGLRSISIVDDDKEKLNASTLGYNFFVGGKYNINEKTGVFVELGYGVAILSAGLTFKIK